MAKIEENKFIFVETKVKDYGGPYPITGGSFAVDNVSVGGEYEPEQGVDCHNLNDEKELSFKFSKILSADVADDFRDYCVDSWRNTFNKFPERLHFAVIGKLKLKFEINDEAHEPYNLDFHFPNVVLAQGKSGQRHNWWFGGHDCIYIPSDYGNWKNAVVLSGYVTEDNDDNILGNAAILVRRGEGTGVYKAEVTVLYYNACC